MPHTTPLPQHNKKREELHRLQEKYPEQVGSRALSFPNLCPGVRAHKCSMGWAAVAFVGCRNATCTFQALDVAGPGCLCSMAAGAPACCPLSRLPAHCPQAAKLAAKHAAMAAAATKKAEKAAAAAVVEAEEDEEPSSSEDEEEDPERLISEKQQAQARSTVCRTRQRLVVLPRCRARVGPAACYAGWEGCVMLLDPTQGDQRRPAVPLSERCCVARSLLPLQIFETLLKIRRRDQSIYQPDSKFYSSEEEEEEAEGEDGGTAGALAGGAGVAKGGAVAVHWQA